MKKRVCVFQKITVESSVRRFRDLIRSAGFDTTQPYRVEYHPYFDGWKVTQVTLDGPMAEFEKREKEMPEKNKIQELVEFLRTLSSEELEEFLVKCSGAELQWIMKTCSSPEK